MTKMFPELPPQFDSHRQGMMPLVSLLHRLSKARATYRQLHCSPSRLPFQRKRRCTSDCPQIGENSTESLWTIAKFGLMLQTGML
jgi:hypothetical protein